ncbi:MAG TPA: dihydrofolate reductase family protein, partial [Candidatus Binataceae bacterium]|nr:dihydrofolate reductase family protein [Candidatus Binataceae bacterium]
SPEMARRVRRRYGAEVEAIAAPCDKDGIALQPVMRELARRGWSKVLIEGGARLAGAALKAGMVDRVAFFVAPRIIGAGLPAIEGLETVSVRRAIGLENLEARQVGSDWLLEGNIIRTPGRRISRRS